VEDGWRYAMAPNGEIRLVVTTQGSKRQGTCVEDAQSRGLLARSIVDVGRRLSKVLQLGGALEAWSCFR
jgi:hypothetical protein